MDKKILRPNIDMGETLQAVLKEEKKSLVLKKTLSLFLAFGIRAVSMKDISDTLGMSKKTLYMYFSTKEMLLEACIKSLVKEQLQEISAIENMPISRIEKVCLIYKSSLRNIANQHSSFYNDMRRDYPNIDKVYTDMYRDFLNNRIFNMLSESQRNNEVLEGIDLDLFCQIHLFKLKEFFSNKDIHQKNRQERILNHSIAISLRGILRNPDSIDWDLGDYLN
ncbi:MAG: helix-turn-helix domain-containing protein [Bacteroidota bacterium]